MTHSNAYKLLVVDDEPDILEFLKYNLLKEGYQVITTIMEQMQLVLRKNINHI